MLKPVVRFVVIAIIVIGVSAQAGFADEADGIRIQNLAENACRYQLRFPNGSNWSETHKIEPGGRDDWLDTSRPLLIRFSGQDAERTYAITPGATYRFVTRGGMTDLFLIPKHTVGKLSLPSPAPTNQDWRGPIREIKLLVLADEGYRRSFPAWQHRLQEIIAGASTRFESEFGLRFSVIEYRAWAYSGVRQTSEQRWETLRRVEPVRADIAVGFIGLGSYRTGTEGEAVPFAQHLLISDSHEFTSNRAKDSLVHELAHVFGAFHVSDKQSIMQRSHESIPIAFRFGDPERETILLTRNFVFTSGVDSLSADTVRRIHELYHAHRHPSEPVNQDPITRANDYRDRVPRARSAENDQPRRQTPDDTLPESARSQPNSVALDWPSYLEVLAGSNEVRIQNPNSFYVRAALRFDRKGKDWIIRPKGAGSVFVPDGNYDIYFHKSNEPDSLYQGDSFALNSNGVVIVIQGSPDGNYRIWRVK